MTINIKRIISQSTQLIKRIKRIQLLFIILEIIVLIIRPYPLKIHSITTFNISLRKFKYST